MYDEKYFKSHEKKLLFSSTHNLNLDQQAQILFCFYLIYVVVQDIHIFFSILC